MNYYKAAFAYLVLGSFLLAGCGTEETHDHETLTPEEMEQHVLETHTDESGNIVYTCPMHPEIRENEPGSCPICGMDLTPVQLEANTREGETTNPPPLSEGEEGVMSGMSPLESFPVAPQQQQLIGVQYDTVATIPLEHTFRTVGFLTHAEPNLTDIVPRVSGYIEEVHVGETGVHVMEGEPLVTIYSPELVSSQEEYLIALRSGNESVSTRARRRLELLHMPESEIQKLEEQRAPLLEVTLTAPASGHVMGMHVRQGMDFNPGTSLYRLNDHSLLWMQAEIYENDFPFVHTGQQVTLEIQGQPGTRFEGTVSFIPPVANEQTRTIPVRIEVPNPDFRLKMNQYGWVTFREELGDRLSVHRDAVLKTGRRDVVFKETGPGRFAPVEVHLGSLAGDRYEVLHGLEEGERVVTSGRFWLDAESRLRGLGAEAAAAHQH